MLSVPSVSSNVFKADSLSATTWMTSQTTNARPIPISASQVVVVSFRGLIQGHIDSQGSDTITRAMRHLCPADHVTREQSLAPAFGVIPCPTDMTVIPCSHTSLLPITTLVSPVEVRSRSKRRRANEKARKKQARKGKVRPRHPNRHPAPFCIHSSRGALHPLPNVDPS